MPGDPSPIQLSVVVLTYRSGKVLNPWVRQLHQSLSVLNIRWEIILVANVWEGELDPTQEIARSLEKSLPHIRMISFFKKGGLGWDVKTGLEASRGEVMAYIDGDGQIPADAILIAYQKMIREDLHLVHAYRRRRGDGVLRWGLSRLYNLAFRLCFGSSHKDINAKPKIFDRKTYQIMDLQSDDWFIDAEIMKKAHELKIPMGEFPISFYPHTVRTSLVGWSTVWEFCKNFWAYRFKKKNSLATTSSHSVKG